jgi:hypothetical protein
MSPQVENNRAEDIEAPPTLDSPNLSTSSSKTSSPLPGSPDQILQTRLLRPTSPDRHDFDHPPIHRSPDRGFFKEILNNRFVLCCALFASLGGILFGYDVRPTSILTCIEFSIWVDWLDSFLARSNFSDVGYGPFQFSISSNRPACFGWRIG